MALRGMFLVSSQSGRPCGRTASGLRSRREGLGATPLSHPPMELRVSDGKASQAARRRRRRMLRVQGRAILALLRGNNDAANNGTVEAGHVLCTSDGDQHCSGMYSSVRYDLMHVDDHLNYVGVDTATFGCRKWPEL